MRIRLDAIEFQDLAQLRVWRNDIMHDGYVRQWRYLNELDQEDWLVRITRSNEHIMMKVLDENDIMIGVVGLCYVDYIRRSGEVSIYIGDFDRRRMGYGKEALTALLNYGFGTMNLHRIWGEIYIHNLSNIKLFEALKFKQEGVLRDRHFFNGKYVDARIYSILEDEWPYTS